MTYEIHRLTYGAGYSVSKWGKADPQRQGLHILSHGKILALRPQMCVCVSVEAMVEASKKWEQNIGDMKVENVTIEQEELN